MNYTNKSQDYPIRWLIFCVTNERIQSFKLETHAVN